MNFETSIELQIKSQFRISVVNLIYVDLLLLEHITRIFHLYCVCISVIVQITEVRIRKVLLYFWLFQLLFPFYANNAAGNCLISAIFIVARLQYTVHFEFQVSKQFLLQLLFLFNPGRDTCKSGHVKFHVCCFECIFKLLSGMFFILKFNYLENKNYGQRPK